jgi:hypothetical protein
MCLSASVLATSLPPPPPSCEPISAPTAPMSSSDQALGPTGSGKALYSTGMCCTKPGDAIQALTPSENAFPSATISGSSIDFCRSASAWS